MQSPPLHLHKTPATTTHHHQHHLGFRHSLSTAITQNLISSLSLLSNFPKSIPKKFITQNRKHNSNSGKERVRVKGKKENVWSIDNELAKAQKERERAKQRRRRGKRNKNGRVLVSGAMLMEVETVLQTQEPVIKPSWNTFANTVSGIWKGVGAVFSPITAEMEPIDIGNKSEHLYDCYTLSCIEVETSTSGSRTSQIQRKINWVTLNPLGETSHHLEGSNRSKKGFKIQDASLSTRERVHESEANNVLPKFESFDFATSDVVEEDVMGNEPGLVFFEDGSYSRGPINIPVGEVDESNYYLSPTFKFEQCLVKGCHKRLRIVHTIEFNNGGSDIQIMRVAVYEEWVSPADPREQSAKEPSRQS